LKPTGGETQMSYVPSILFSQYQSAGERNVHVSQIKGENGMI